MDKTDNLDADTMILLNAVTVYCNRTGKSRATVATHVANDGKFFDRIENGGGFTTKTKNKVMGWFKENTPCHKSPKKVNQKSPSE